MVNQRWAYTLINTLIDLGADYFACAPGSRSTPLLLAVASHPKAKSLVHFDERGLGFHALGYAKATKKPTVIVVTSGTAVANLLPAVMEANHEKIPLILLTADRPPELRDCGANQACDQVKLFQSQVRWEVDLPCPDASLLERYLTSTISHAVTMATANMPGPVHINCMFREPFLDSDFAAFTQPQTCSFTRGELHLSEYTLDEWAEKISQSSQGILVLGSDCTDSYAQAIFLLAEKLHWPIFADILSPSRHSKNHPLLITHFDLILKLKPDLKADAVIYFGERMVSKTWIEWIQRQKLAFYLQITPHPRRQDPCHLVTHRLQTSANSFATQITQRLNFKNLNSRQHPLTQANLNCRKELTAYFEHSTKLTEPSVLWHLHTLLSQDWALFLANSMPIRDANQFLPSLPESGPLYGNRGVSGIDGNIATAAGIAAGLQQKTVALLGDLSCLHDLNSLALLKQIKPPLVLCVINNQGGGIFSFLPIAEQKAHFEQFFAAAHSWTLSAAAELFQIPYFQPTTTEELQQIFDTLNTESISCLIEIKTNRQDNVTVHQEILKRLRGCSITKF